MRLYYVFSHTARSVLALLVYRWTANRLQSKFCSETHCALLLGLGRADPLSLLAQFSTGWSQVRWFQTACWDFGQVFAK